MDKIKNLIETMVSDRKLEKKKVTKQIEEDLKLISKDIEGVK